MTDPTERLLRDALAEQARRAPRGDGLAERIIASADRPLARSAPRSPRWRTWALPLVAAASVAAVVGGLLGTGALQGHPSHRAALAPASTPAPQPSRTTPTVPSQPLRTVVNPPVAVATPPGIGPVPERFRALDATFVSATDGWALGTGQCFADAAKTCTSLIRTADGGTNWISVPNPPANVPGVNGCADPCVEHVRFADDRIGYAYGPSALFMTTDGTHWTRQPGGAAALETLDGNAIRVSSVQPGCIAPGCTYKVQVAPNGSPSWTTVPLPGAPVIGDGVTLSRTGSAAYLLVYENPAGGAQNATSTLFSSADDGQHWTRRGEVCAQRGGEVDSTGLTTAPDGSVTVLCAPRQAPQTPTFTATSTDGGATFRPAPATLGRVTAIGSSSASVLLASSDALYRSTDGGTTWVRATTDRSVAPDSPKPFLGFETPTTGRWIPGDGSTIWTTIDAGATWRPHTFG